MKALSGSGLELGALQVEPRLVPVRLPGGRTERDAVPALVAEVGQHGDLEPLGHAKRAPAARGRELTVRCTFRTGSFTFERLRPVRHDRQVRAHAERRCCRRDGSRGTARLPRAPPPPTACASPPRSPSGRRAARAGSPRGTAGATAGGEVDHIDGVGALSRARSRMPGSGPATRAGYSPIRSAIFRPSPSALTMDSGPFSTASPPA